MWNGIRTRGVLGAGLLAILAATPLAAEEPHFTGLGVTRAGTEIGVWLPADANDLASERRRVVLVAGLDGTRRSSEAVKAAWRRYHRDPDLAPLRKSVSLAVVPTVLPEGLPEGESVTFPPRDGFYDAKQLPEARYLWRWLGLYGADTVIEVRSNSADYDQQLARSLFVHPPAEVGTVFGRTVVLPGDETDVETLLVAVRTAADAPKSAARRVLERRVARSPREVAEELAAVYGHSLRQVAYIPALGVLGRWKLATETDDPAMLASVRAVLEPFAQGERSPIPRSASEQAGHILFAELAKADALDAKAQWVDLCRNAADQIFDEQGELRPMMPFHSEMSDSFFMALPILAATGELTGDTRYHEGLQRHFRAMRKLCDRPDGLFRHSPLDEAAWGRGNGFGAVGLAWVLSELPPDHPLREEILGRHRQQLRALLRHQDHTGCWHQVIDRPGSYREFTCTCMIAWAMLRGIERGWLDEAEFGPAVRRAWHAISQRVGPEGRLVDVCTGTGKQRDLRAYYDRPAILGRDDRGGAMGLLLSTELVAAQRFELRGTRKAH